MILYQSRLTEWKESALSRGTLSANTPTDERYFNMSVPSTRLLWLIARDITHFSSCLLDLCVVFEGMVYVGGFLLLFL